MEDGVGERKIRKTVGVLSLLVMRLDAGGAGGVCLMRRFTDGARVAEGAARAKGRKARPFVHSEIVKFE